MGRPRDFDEQVVLGRAMEEFWTHGYAGTSPAMLLEATGLGKGSLYNAFHGKRQLFERCLELYHQRVLELAKGLLEHPGSTAECLRAALRAVVDGDLAQPERRGCLIGNTITEMAGSEPDLARRLQQMQDETTGWFRDRIRRGQAAGDVSADRSAADLADHFATTLAGLRVMAVTHEAPMLYRVIDTALLVL